MHDNEQLVAHPEHLAPSTVVCLNARIDSVMSDVSASQLWRWVSDPSTPAGLVTAFLREVYWDIHCYQPFTTTAGFAMIGRMAAADRREMRTLLLHKWEEVEHRVWALDGYKALGGDLTRLGREDRYMSPNAFAVAAVWERLACRCNPLAYLGAEYLFEALTANVARMVMGVLRRCELPVDGVRFVADHVEEDQRHTAMLVGIVTSASDRYPDTHYDILYAFDAFRTVYPLPLWNAAYERALNVSRSDYETV